jgi:glycosyltransferase involved in cell wall biosynthesis
LKILIFFTYNVSLKQWAELGLIKREILLYQKLVTKGCKVTLFTYGDAEDFKYGSLLGDINVVPAYAKLRRPKNKLIRFIHSFAIPFFPLAIFKSVDLYKTNQMLGSWVPIITKILYNKPLIIRCGYELFRNKMRTSIFSPINIFYYILELFSYNLANKVIISNKTDKLFIKKLFPIHYNKVSINRNIIDTSIFSPENNYRREKNITNGVLYIGRFVDRKNLVMLFQALLGTNIHIGLVGDGYLKKSLESMATKNNIDVKFYGIIPNNKLPDIINRYPVCILPSKYENNPKTLLEYMACKRAVIGSNVPGIKEIIINNFNGIFCANNPDSIRDSISLLLKDKKLRQKLGTNARHYIEKNCSPEIVVKKEYSIYKDVLKIRNF